MSTSPLGNRCAVLRRLRSWEESGDVGVFERDTFYSRLMPPEVAFRGRGHLAFKAEPVRHLARRSLVAGLGADRGVAHLTSRGASSVDRAVSRIARRGQFPNRRSRGRPPECRAAGRGGRGVPRRGPGATAGVQEAPARAAHSRSVRRRVLSSANKVREHRRAEAPPAQLTEARNVEIGARGFTGGLWRRAPYSPSRALAVETHENWLEQHRYLNMDDLREHKKEGLRRAA
jgi:hypothetical protein